MRFLQNALRSSMDDESEEALGPIGSRVAVGIVGAGAMGSGIAQVAALAGHRVHLFDTREGAARSAIEGILAIIDKLVSKGRVTRDQAMAVRQNLQPIDSIDGLAGSGLIIEAIVESLQAKRDVFRSVEDILSENVLLATNTSSISVTAIGSALRHPERLFGMHFFNPAPLMPLVEIVSGAATSIATASIGYATANAWGKTPVHARSTPGFIVNRVARPFYAEALRVLSEGAADFPTIDAVLREAGGFRMGPFELMDFIGHDINYAVTRSVFDGFFGDPRFTPSLLQLELVEAGYLGRKTGRGFYSYDPPASEASAQSCLPCKAPSDIRLFGNGPLVNALAQRLVNADIKIERVADYDDGRLVDCESFVLYLSDGRTATARSEATGVSNVVLMDLAFDYASAQRLAIAAADQSDSLAIERAAGLLQAAGYQVSSIDDVPGMIVLRTVAMLANEAADAVNQRVCTTADCDLAMRKGVSYPRGPLEWADALGLSTVVVALDHLAQAYGENRYRVSPLLRRKAQTNAQFTT